jgi:solute carrier family 25 (mitochondrial S-adenosylmethionine transporter), member 26
MTDAPRWWVPLAAGGCAGTAVDVCLFPLDTIKTRLQSSAGFRKAGGFTGVYRGLGAAAAASAPAAAVFFQSYVTMKGYLLEQNKGMWAPSAHMAAAAFGEVTSALVRVPFEIVKQQLQAHVYASNTAAVKALLTPNGMSGMLRSYVSLVSREIPFSLLQYPLYEFFKSKAIESSGPEGSTAGWKLSLCGSLAGGLAAAATTPLDVAKTRVMLDTNSKRGTYGMLLHLAHTEGFPALFRGLAPRVMWISIGGAVFFGMYERAVVFFGSA